MAEADLDLVRRWFELAPANLATAFTDEHFIARARPALERLLATDFVFLAGEDDFTGLGGEYAGVEGFLAFARDWYAAWSMYSQELIELIDLGEGRVLALGQEHGRSRAAGVEIDGEFGSVFYVEDGRFRRIEAYQHWSLARRAAGLEGERAG